MLDFILNGQGHGDVAATLLANNFDVRCLRPYIGDDGRSYIDSTDPRTGEPVAMLINSVAPVRKDEWRLMDNIVIEAAKARLRAVADLRAANLVFNLPNGMAHTVLSHERQSDISDATISMDGLRESQADRPVYDLVNLPLPIIHKDFQFPARQVMVSRNGSTPVDTTTARLAGRKVGELAEKLLLGTLPSYTYGGGTLYGYTNFPQRLTHSMTLPTAMGWTPSDTVDEVLDMRLQSQAAFHYGPWKLYTSPNWDRYLDADYSAAKGDNTLRARIKNIDGIDDIRTLDYLTGYQMILVEFQEDVVREVIGMDVMTIQWPSQGGFLLNFKVLAMMVPQIRCDQNDNTGLVHGVAA